MSDYEIELDKKALLIASVLALFLFISGIYSSGNGLTGLLVSDSEIEEDEKPSSEEEEYAMRVAACPTFYYMLSELDDRGFRVYPTGSTSKSIRLFEEGKVDAFISGRPLKEEEPQLDSKLLGPGFSFIYIEEKEVSVEELEDYTLYTDLPKAEVLPAFDKITEENLEEVGDIYAYIDSGIGITSFHNTDYSRSELVHVFTDDGYRHRFSRVPALYYDSRKLEDEELVEELDSIDDFLEEGSL